MSGRLHICLVHGWFPPISSYGGIVRYIVALAKGYVQLGHDVTVITRDDLDPRREVWQGTNIHRVKVNQGKLSRVRPARALLDSVQASAAYAAKIRELDEEEHVDVVEFSNYSSEGLVHSFNKRVPHVTRVVTMGWQSHQINASINGSNKITIGDRWRCWCEEVAIKKSDFILTPTQAHADIIREKFGNHLRPLAVPLGAQMERLSNDLPDKSCDTIEFLFVGKIDPRKGFETLVKAFADVHVKSDGRVRLKVIGTDTDLAPGGGSFKEYALSLIPEAPRRSIDFLGWVSDEDLPFHYANCDVFVAPSRYESFGLIYLEAMQCRKPVIGCMAGGVPEVVQNGDTGILVPPENETALADAMMTLACSKEERARLGNSGFSRWQSEFTERRMCERSIDAYRKLIQCRHRGIK